jgi:hypothetical protein
MLIKINDLEERLLETQLQLERVSDKKLTHMLSIQKCPTDKTGLGYVPTSISNTPSTSKTIFVRPVILESPPPRMDMGKAVMEGEVPFNPQPLVKLPIRRKSPTCHHCGELGTSDQIAHIGKFSRRKNGWLLKLRCVTNVELAVISDQGVLHLSLLSIIDLRPEIVFQSFNSCRSLLKEKRLGSPRRLQEGKSPLKEHLLPVLSCKIWSDF